MSCNDVENHIRKPIMGWPMKAIIGNYAHSLKHELRYWSIWWENPSEFVQNHDHIASNTVPKCWILLTSHSAADSLISQKTPVVLLGWYNGKISTIYFFCIIYFSFYSLHFIVTRNCWRIASSTYFLLSFCTLLFPVSTTSRHLWPDSAK